MKLHRSRVCITLWPMVDSSLACCGEPREFPADLGFRVVKRKRTTVLIRARNAGFAWVHPSDLDDASR
jgi:hypothetical protein